MKKWHYDDENCILSGFLMGFVDLWVISRIENYFARLIEEQSILQALISKENYNLPHE